MDESDATKWKQQQQQEQSNLEVAPNAGQMGFSANQNDPMGAPGNLGERMPAPTHPLTFSRPAHQLDFQPSLHSQQPHQQQQEQFIKELFTVDESDFQSTPQQQQIFEQLRKEILDVTQLKPQQQQEEQTNLEDIMSNTGQIDYVANQNAPMGNHGNSGVTMPAPGHPQMFSHPAHRLKFQPSPNFQHPHQQQQQQQQQQQFRMDKSDLTQLIPQQQQIFKQFTMDILDVTQLTPQQQKQFILDKSNLTQLTTQQQGEQSNMQGVAYAGQNAPIIAPGNSRVTIPALEDAPMFPHPAQQLGFQPSLQFQNTLGHPPTFLHPAPRLNFQPTPKFQHPNLHQQPLRKFWTEMQEIEKSTGLTQHNFPLRRIRKIMGANKDVSFVSPDAVTFFAKACEIFIMDMTLQSWIYRENNRSNILQKSDIAAAILRTSVFDFLVDNVRKNELDGRKGKTPMTESPVDMLFHSFQPPPYPITVPAAGTSMGSLADMPFYSVPPLPYPLGGFAAGSGSGNLRTNPAAMYPFQYPHPSLPYLPWLQPQQQPEDQEQPKDNNN